MSIRDDLKAYLDGELAPDRHEEVRVAIESDPTLQEELASLKSISGSIGRIARDFDVRGFEQTLDRVSRRPMWQTLGLKWAGSVAALATVAVIAVTMMNRRELETNMLSGDTGVDSYIAPVDGDAGSGAPSSGSEASGSEYKSGGASPSRQEASENAKEPSAVAPHELATDVGKPGEPAQAKRAAPETKDVQDKLPSKARTGDSQHLGMLPKELAKPGETARDQKPETAVPRPAASGKSPAPQSEGSARQGPVTSKPAPTPSGFGGGAGGGAGAHGDSGDVRPRGGAGGMARPGAQQVPNALSVQVIELHVADLEAAGSKLGSVIQTFRMEDSKPGLRPTTENRIGYGSEQTAGQRARTTEVEIEPSQLEALVARLKMLGQVKVQPRTRAYAPQHPTDIREDDAELRMTVDQAKDAMAQAKSGEQKKELEKKLRSAKAELSSLKEGQKGKALPRAMKQESKLRVRIVLKRK